MLLSIINFRALERLMKLLSILLKRFSLLSKLCSNKMCLCFYVAAIFINHIQKLHHPHMNTSSNLLLGLFFLKITYFSPFISSHHLAQKNTIECVGVYDQIVIGQQGVDVLPLLSWILTSA